MNTRHLISNPGPRGSLWHWPALLPVLLLALIALALPRMGWAQSDWASLQDGSIVLFRHANAPGFSDPSGFTLNDCSTQRNLDATGRDQARRIGEQFRSRRIPVREVLSSQWCRTRETAQLAFPGLVRDAAPFNSFFETSERQAAQTAAALDILKQWQGPGVLVVVTHQVNITALTGISPASGQGVIVKPGQSGLAVLGRVQP
jgi:phosphohistidine phosphatase SixA